MIVIIIQGSKRVKTCWLNYIIGTVSIKDTIMSIIIYVIFFPRTIFNALFFFVDLNESTIIKKFFFTLFKIKCYRTFI